MRPLVIAYGGTVEPIDDVRVRTNLSRGALGRELVREALERGARVHALVGRFAAPPDPHRRLRTEEFGATLDLARRLEAALRAPRAVPGLAMAAAVSDYRPRRLVRGKIRSDASALTIELVRNPKLVDRVARWRPGTRLVSFKLGGDRTPERELLALAEAQRLRTGSLGVVANRYPKTGRHTAFWVDAAGVARLPDRAAIAARVVEALLA
ncbi:MAG TPA: phosphopantothenoylcysteine decarboxylase, partial [Planctomycetota bacterium]|nr:phosphopantothenoylcysteine decarboxylase [Planctomycetota bacterium]